MGAGTMTRNMRLGLAILAAVLTITPEPGYTVACGFESPDDMDWGETLWVWSEKR